MAEVEDDDSVKKSSAIENICAWAMFFFFLLSHPIVASFLSVSVSQEQCAVLLDTWTTADDDDKNNNKKVMLP